MDKGGDAGSSVDGDSNLCYDDGDLICSRSLNNDGGTDSSVESKSNAMTFCCRRDQDQLFFHHVHYLHALDGVSKLHDRMTSRWHHSFYCCSLREPGRHGVFHSCLFRSLPVLYHL